ncbi:MAG: APC family permease [Lentisphaerota bacterium]
MTEKRRTIGLMSLIFSAVLMQVGSAWLFGVGLTAKIAGPAAIFTWIIGAIVMSFIALTIAEVAPCFPKMGGLGRYLKYSHGDLSAFLGDWAGFLALIFSVIVEAVSIVQYASSWPFAWAKLLYNTTTSSLTFHGLIFASFIVIILFIVNALSLKVLMHSIKGLGIFKVFVIICAVAIPIIYLGHLSFSNFVSYHKSFVPYGWSSVWTAIAVGGVIPAFVGFQAPVSFAGEAKNPGRNIPLAIILAMVISMVIYTCLQFTFLYAFPLNSIGGNWQNLSLQSPFVDLTTLLGLHFLTLLLFSDALLAPTTTGIILMGAAPRTLYGLHSTKHIPRFLGKISRKTYIPLNALIFSLVLSVGILWLVPSWEKVISILTLCYMINFLAGPAAAIGLRKNAKDLVRTVKIPCMPVISFISFLVIAFLLLACGWPRTAYMSFALLAGFAIYLYYEYKVKKFVGFSAEIKSSIWLIVFMPFVSLFDYLASDKLGGIGIFSAYSPAHIICFVAGISIIFYLMLKFSRRTEALEQVILAQVKEQR